jgi:hypothetical protein
MLLAVFNKLTTQGIWKLKVKDTLFGDNGRLHYGELKILAVDVCPVAHDLFTLADSELFALGLLKQLPNVHLMALPMIVAGLRLNPSRRLTVVAICIRKLHLMALPMIVAGLRLNPSRRLMVFAICK